MTIDIPRLGRLIRKELNEILRDRRTIITLVLMPVLLYPLLSVAFQQFFLASQASTEDSVEYQLGFVSEKEAALLLDRLRLGDRVLELKQPPQPPEKKRTTFHLGPSISIGEFSQLEALLRAGKLDAIIRLSKSKTAAAGQSDATFDFEVIYRASSSGSLGALAHLEQRLAAANEAALGALLDEFRRARRPVGYQLIRVAKTVLDEPQRGAFISLASLVPLILILMTITGAVYPAIDLTAGERERGTLEILVAAPVPRLGLLFAKYVSVVTVAVLTGLVNLIAMTATLVLSGVALALFPNQGLSLVTVVQVFGLLLLFAAFFSAVLLCITSFARSFKEAQAYLIPLMLVSLAPGVMGMVPGLLLSSWAAAPLVNIVLLARDLFEGNAELGPAVIVVGTTLVYAAAAIALAARIFGDEGVLYSEQTSWGDLFRRPSEPQTTARLAPALWCLALMIPVNFVLRGVGMLLIQGEILQTSDLPIIGIVRTVLIFGVLPALFAWRARLLMVPAFAMVGAPALTFVGAAILGASLWPLIFAGMAWLDVQPAEWQRSLYEQTAEALRTMMPSVKIGMMVLTGILEEWFFRGYLYGALRKHGGAASAIVLSALLFGAMHFILLPEFGLVRALPSAVMGLVLGAVREAGGSVLPAMLLHAGHNALVASLIREGPEQATAIEPWWIAAGAIGMVVGAALTWLGRTRAASHEP